MSTDDATISGRIRRIMDASKMSQQDFAAKLEISPASLSSIFNGRTNPTNNHTVAIHRAFPKINLNWLLFGEGEMEETSTGGNANTPSTPIPSNDLFSNIAQTENSAPPHYDPAERTRRNIYNNETPYTNEVKRIDIKKRVVKEIRVFFDDGTYETFVPQK